MKILYIEEDTIDPDNLFTEKIIGKKTFFDRRNVPSYKIICLNCKHMFIKLNQLRIFLRHIAMSVSI